MNKLRKAKIIAHLLSTMPYVRLVVLTGSVAAGRDDQNSDLDFLIVSQRGRLYLARYLCVGLVTILGQKSYPRSHKTAGRVCLNFYVADNFLDFSKIDGRKLKKRGKWLMESLPLAGKERIYKRLMKNNDLKPLPWDFDKIETLDALQSLFEFILAFGGGAILEKISFAIASRRLSRHRQETKSQGVLFNKNYIKLHIGRWK